MQDKLKEQLEKYCWNEHHFEPLANYERLESFIDQNFIGKEWALEKIEKRMKDIHDFEDNGEIAVRTQSELLSLEKVLELLK